MANFGGPVAPQGLHLAGPNLALLLIHLVSIQRNEKKLRGEFSPEGRGPRPPKNFGVPKRDFLIVRCKKMKIGKKSFLGVGAPPPPPPHHPKLKSTPCGGLNVVSKFQPAMTILTRFISPQSCSPLYKSACWTWNIFTELPDISVLTIFDFLPNKFGNS